MPRFNAAKHIERKLEATAAQAKEDKARWMKDHPLREPGTSLRTWKSYSQQRFSSEQYRIGWDRIFNATE